MIEAATLVEVLEAENAALRALDFPGATALLGAKQSAASALAGTAARPPAELARRLATAAAENRALLERAMAVQARVLGVIGRAVPRALGRGAYGASGGAPVRGVVRPVALSTAV